MEITPTDKKLDCIRGKIMDGIRLDFDDALAMYQTHDLIGLGRLAGYVRGKRHGKKAFYIYNQHLNYTNVCSNRCLFCAFARDEGQDKAFTLSMDQIKSRLEERSDEPISELHIVGGINPSLDFDYYLNLLDTVRSIRPDAVIKAFTAVEIDHLSRISGMSLDDTIKKLKESGLSMVPGGGAEVLSDRVKEELFPKKIDYRRWLDVMTAIHSAGIVSNATMLYGHIETIEERAVHLIRLRELQDSTKGFSAFIPLAFHSENTRLPEIMPTTGFDDLKNVAIARLMLDNFDHIKAYWVMIGEKLAQVALSFGADDLDGTIIEEKITHMAGAKSAKGLSDKEMERLIVTAGFTPVLRDSFYLPIKKDGKKS
ncbi:aminofutalosine synthase MqnE [Desulfobacterales bacterium HSG16]|nr:aminofutalosine synthase MqnE [Desulfobacterales bacterium HSG16]